MQNSDRNTRPLYRERLAPSLWVFAAAAIAGPMVSFTLVPVGTTIALVLGLLAAVAVIAALYLLSPSIVVDGTTLRAGRARIDARWLGEPVALTGDAAREARGPGLPARGWHVIRGGIDGLAIVPIIDPADPVTSWTLSSRTPDRLAAAIEHARAVEPTRAGDRARTKTRPGS